MKHAIPTVRSWLASRRFFYAVVALLVLQAGWIALSGRYAMAYDEQNHLGVVKLYAEHGWPFWAEQPPGPAPYSAVSRDASFLYHWLMSWPYRIFDLFLHNDDAKVLAFRFISIGLFAWGLVLYRRLLLRTGASPALVHTVLALFVLIPTVPFLAAQMNYDNLLFVIVAGSLLLATRLIDDMRQRRLPAISLMLFLGLLLAGSLTKFPFLAILLPLVAWLSLVFFRSFGKKGWRRAGRQLRQTFVTAPRWLRVAAVVAVLLPGVMFVERYGGNIVRYGTPTPECDQVLDVERCSAFGPWFRNYNIYQSKLNGTLQAAPSLGIFHFTYYEWLGVLLWQFFYVLNGPIDNFSIGHPLPLPYHVGVGLVTVGAVLVVVFRRAVFRRPYLRGLMFVAMFYVFVLWAQNYADFLRLNIATAIQARYIVLVLPVLLLAIALAYNGLLQRWLPAKIVLALPVFLLLLTQGGGLGVFIARSNPTWWWQSGRVVQANQTAQRWLAPIMWGEERPRPNPPRSPQDNRTFD